MPYALHQSGVGLGIILMIFVAVMTDYSLVLMVRAGELSGSYTYAGMMEAAFGRPGFYLLSLTQFVYPIIGKAGVWIFKNFRNWKVKPNLINFSNDQLQHNCRRHTHQSVDLLQHYKIHWIWTSGRRTSSDLLRDPSAVAVSRCR